MVAAYGVLVAVIGKTGVRVGLVVRYDVIEGDGDGDAVDVPVAVGVSVTM